MCFRLCLKYRDETKASPTTGEFDHVWVMSPLEMDRAEREGRTDFLVLQRRAREQRRFLRMVAWALRESRARLERNGRELVLRRAVV